MHSPLPLDSQYTFTHQTNSRHLSPASPASQNCQPWLNALFPQNKLHTFAPFNLILRFLPQTLNIRCISQSSRDLSEAANFMACIYNQSLVLDSLSIFLFLLVITVSYLQALKSDTDTVKCRFVTGPSCSTEICNLQTKHYTTFTTYTTHFQNNLPKTTLSLNQSNNFKRPKVPKWLLDVSSDTTLPVASPAARTISPRVSPAGQTMKSPPLMRIHFLSACARTAAAGGAGAAAAA